MTSESQFLVRFCLCYFVLLMCYVLIYVWIINCLNVIISVSSRYKLQIVIFTHLSFVKAFITILIILCWEFSSKGYIFMSCFCCWEGFFNWNYLSWFFELLLAFLEIGTFATIRIFLKLYFKKLFRINIWVGGVLFYVLSVSKN